MRNNGYGNSDQGAAEDLRMLRRDIDVVIVRFRRKRIPVRELGLLDLLALLVTIDQLVADGFPFTPSQIANMRRALAQLDKAITAGLWKIQQAFFDILGALPPPDARPDRLSLEEEDDQDIER